MNTEYWHRIEDRHYATMEDEWGRSSSYQRIEHFMYVVVRRTPKGVWLDLGFHKRFVLLDAKKQWASPTFEAARDHFKARKRRQISILQAQLNDAKAALAGADSVERQDSCLDSSGASSYTHHAT
jgi:hypothetical protein